MMDVVIVGGGASGLMAAVLLAREGKRVMILEKNDRVGKKLLATGNGRCNYTNLYASPKHYYSEDPDFTYLTLDAFTPEDTLTFFKSIGIEPKVEEEGKVYPLSEQASSFLDAFLLELKRLGVVIKTGEEVTSIKEGFSLHTKDNTYKAKAVLFTPGGHSMPKSGSDGTAYRLVTKLGHHLIEPFPSLVQLELEGDFFKRVDGVKIKGEASLYHEDKLLATEKGDLLFTSYGISGPPILQLSRPAGALLKSGIEPILRIKLYDLSFNEMLELLKKRREDFFDRDIDSFLIGLVNKRLSGALYYLLGLNFKDKVESLTDSHLEGFARYLTDWPLKVTGNKGYATSQATAGGIDTKDVSPYTLESNLVPGLFFAGEVLDVDGRCGGYNLQWAWASAFVASRQIGELIDTRS